MYDITFRDLKRFYDSYEYYVSKISIKHVFYNNSVTESVLPKLLLQVCLTDYKKN